MDKLMQDEGFLRRMKIRMECGAEINRAVAMYEDVTRYPVQELVDLFKMQQKIMETTTKEERDVLRVEFASAMDRIQLLPDAPDRIYLWEEGNMPAHTEYVDNSDYRYDHELDFKPFLLEMLLPEDVKPVGAVVTIAGGTHGAGTLNECYQICKEFNELGYQGFVLQCRPNGSPWDAYETGADAARACRIIRANAEKYRLDPKTIALAGFSNGGITIDYCIEYFSGEKKVTDYFPEYQPDALDELYGGPDAYLCVYGPRHAGTPYNYEGVVYPPTFFAVGRLDNAMDNLHEVYPSLLAQGVPVEVHTFAGHPHGYAGWKIIDGKGNPNFDLWVTHADVFMRDIFCKE